MNNKVFNAGIAVIALSAAASLSPVMAQGGKGAGKGALYAFHTDPVVGGCPGLDWHVTLSPENKLTGFVAWDQGQHVAKLDGELNKDRTLEISAQEVGGAGRTATVKGTAAGDYVNLTITGTGSPCDGVNLAVPRVAGGTYGGN